MCRVRRPFIKKNFAPDMDQNSIGIPPVPVMSLTSGGATLIRHLKVGDEIKITWILLGHDSTLLKN